MRAHPLRKHQNLSLVLALIAALFSLAPERAKADADARDEELVSASATLLGFTLSTGLMVGLAAIPIVRCDHDLACLGTAIMVIGGFVITHPFVASAGVHLMTSLAGDRQPYWHSLVSQAAGDALAVSAFLVAMKLAPPKPREENQRRTRVLVFTSTALLSLAGPLILRPILDGSKSEPAMGQMMVSF